MDDAQSVEIFKLLEKTGVVEVIGSYSGSGDSGQIDDVTLYSVKQPGEIRAWDDPAPILGLIGNVRDLEQHVERWIEGLMEENEIYSFDNEGSQGSFTVDVAARTVRFDHEWNIESTEDQPFELTFKKKGAYKYKAIKTPTSDKEALDKLNDLLSAKNWPGASGLEDVCAIVRSTGRTPNPGAPAWESH